MALSRHGIGNKLYFGGGCEQVFDCIAQRDGRYISVFVCVRVFVLIDSTESNCNSGGADNVLINRLLLT